MGKGGARRSNQVKYWESLSKTKQQKIDKLLPVVAQWKVTKKRSHRQIAELEIFKKESISEQDLNLIVKLPRYVAAQFKYEQSMEEDDDTQEVDDDDNNDEFKKLLHAVNNRKMGGNKKKKIKKQARKKLKRKREVTDDEGDIEGDEELEGEYERDFINDEGENGMIRVRTPPTKRRKIGDKTPVFLQKYVEKEPTCYYWMLLQEHTLKGVLILSGGSSFKYSVNRNSMKLSVVAAPPTRVNLVGALGSENLVQSGITVEMLDNAGLLRMLGWEQSFSLFDIGFDEKFEMVPGTLKKEVGNVFTFYTFDIAYPKSEEEEAEEVK